MQRPIIMIRKLCLAGLIIATFFSAFSMVDYVEAFSTTETSNTRIVRRNSREILCHYRNYHCMPIITTSTANFMREFQLLASKYDDEVSSSSSPENNNQINQQLNFGGIGSLELLAIATSLFFVLLVAVAGDSLFASPTINAEEQVTTTINGRQQRKIINADEVLRNDFTRIDTSVEF